MEPTVSLIREAIWFVDLKAKVTGAEISATPNQIASAPNPLNTRPAKIRVIPY
jgi:hypothetical protein